MIEIRLWNKNANVTVYVNKKDTLHPLKESKENFVVMEFVKTCDELVIVLQTRRTCEASSLSHSKSEK